MYGNYVEYILEADYAMFTNPVLGVGGEKCSYMVPTYEALKRITGNIYWKPTFIWVIDEIKVINPINYECKAALVRTYMAKGKRDLSYYTYLKKVKYLVKAHFEWNDNFPQFVSDRNVKKHKEMFERALKNGGRMNIFAGTSECPAYVRKATHDDMKSVYDDIDLFVIGHMYHSKGFPNENQNGEEFLFTYFQNIEMKNGWIKYKKQEQCTKRKIKKYPFLNFEDKKGNTNKDEAI